MSTDKRATFHLDAVRTVEPIQSINKARVLPLLEKQTLENTAYRRVLETKGGLQTVAMSLLPGQGIEAEVHPHITQFIRVVSGRIVVNIDGVISIGNHDAWVTVAPGEKHLVKNFSDSTVLKLYTIYSPPNHLEGLVQMEQPEEEKLV